MTEDMTRARIYAQSLGDSANVAYWMDAMGHDASYHVAAAHKDMAKLAAIMGYDLTPIDTTTQAVREVIGGDA